MINEIDIEILFDEKNWIQNISPKHIPYVLGILREIEGISQSLNSYFSHEPDAKEAMIKTLLRVMDWVLIGAQGGYKRYTPPESTCTL